jgi:hypothetical protein
MEQGPQRPKDAATDLTDPGEVFHRILGSEGERVHWQMQALAGAYFVFDGNARELLLRIDQVENREVARRLWDLNNRLDRSHHGNYGELYAGQAFYDEYRSKVGDAFGKSDLASFIKRSYPGPQRSSGLRGGLGGHLRHQGYDGIDLRVYAVELLQVLGQSLACRQLLRAD